MNINELFFFVLFQIQVWKVILGQREWCTPSHKTFLHEIRVASFIARGRRRRRRRIRRRRTRVRERLEGEDEGERKREESRRRQTALTTQGASVHVCAFLCPNPVPLPVRITTPTLAPPSCRRRLFPSACSPPLRRRNDDNPSNCPRRTLRHA